MRLQTLFFTCPNCEERFCMIREFDKDIHTDEVYHCDKCGLRVVFQTVAFDEYIPPPRARKDCPLCNAAPSNR